MALDSTVELFAPIPGRASDGTLKPVWEYTGLFGGVWDDAAPWDDTKIWYDGANATITADVQPKALNEVELQTWGDDISKQDAKVVYDFSFNPYWAVLNRARVDGDKLYKIMSVNSWNTHIEALLAPLVGT
jgi:hypothetical protein